MTISFPKYDFTSTESETDNEKGKRMKTVKYASIDKSLYTNPTSKGILNRYRFQLNLFFGKQ